MGEKQKKQNPFAVIKEIQLKSHVIVFCSEKPIFNLATFKNMTKFNFV